MALGGLGAGSTQPHCRDRHRGTTLRQHAGLPGRRSSRIHPEPWFLADSSTATLRDRKRRLSDRPDRQLSFEGVTPERPPRAKIGLRNRADTKLGRFLQSRNQGVHLIEAAKPDTTPVPREHLPQVTVFPHHGSSGIFSTPSLLSPPPGLCGRSSSSTLAACVGWTQHPSMRSGR